MYTRTIDPKKIRRAFNQIASWDDWEIFQQEWFDIQNWPQRHVDRIGDDLDRPARKIRGRIWESYGEPYDVDPALRQLYEQLRWEIFARLEPEAEAENRRHPERYGHMCVVCRLFTRSNVANCDFCRSELVPLPLNED